MPTAPLPTPPLPAQGRGRTLAAEAAPKWPSVAAIFVVQALVERLALHLVAGLLRRPRGQLVGGAGDLVAQLEVVRQPLRVQGAGLDRGAHRAAGFAVVAAVTEFALFGQRLELGRASSRASVCQYV